MAFARPFFILGALVLGASLLLSSELAAQDERPLGWTDVAEVTFVLTAGNASASTLGLKNTAERLWDKTSVKFSGGAVRTESGITTRTAVGTVDNFTVSEVTNSEVTAENYFVNGRLDRALSDASFLFGGADWNRNTFAGIQNRYGLVAGAGRSWIEKETSRFKTDLGMTYTLQDDVITNPDAEDSFLGIRGSYDFFHKLTETTDLTSGLVLDENLNATEDFRANWTNAIAVAMSERLALKASFQILYDHDPALTAVPLGDVNVLTPLGKVDTAFTLAIVANF